jgi:hypothetical protein
MELVNVRIKHLRKDGYENLKEWCNDEGNEYIGRGQVVFVDGVRYPSKSSVWANPYKVKDYPDTYLQLYEIWMRTRLQTEKGLVGELLKLKDKKLGCWCHPEPCHGNILIELIKEHSNA